MNEGQVTMTDKQIIIDVTQCPYYKEDKTCTYLPYKSKCEGDCNWTSYKEMEEKLKTKEQECERLKEENFTFEKLIKEIEKYGAIEEIIQKGKTPIVVGGTGLYIDSLIYEIEYKDIEINEEYRKKLENN